MLWPVIFWRAIRRGLAGGERARRAFDVFLQRPRPHRNAVWEADHVEAAVEVDVEDRLVKPWVTWFVDAGTNVVCGAAVTPGPASRESILAGLRAAITLEAPYGPPGGLPERVRIDRGKDFLPRTVASVLAGFAVPLTVRRCPSNAACTQADPRPSSQRPFIEQDGSVYRMPKGERRGCSSCTHCGPVSPPSSLRRVPAGDFDVLGGATHRGARLQPDQGMTQEVPATPHIFDCCIFAVNRA